MSGAPSKVASVDLALQSSLAPGSRVASVVQTSEMADDDSSHSGAAAAGGGAGGAPGISTADAGGVGMAPSRQGVTGVTGVASAVSVSDEATVGHCKFTSA